MSEYNYLQNIDDEREFINDDVAAEFDVLNDDIIKFTEGRGEIVYTVMLEDEKRIWFDNRVMEECFFVDFLSHLKNENSEKIELKNRLACVSYNTTYPVMFHSPLAEMGLSSYKICENANELKASLIELVNTRSFRNTLMRARKGTLMPIENDIYRIQFFQFDQYTILFSAERQEVSSQWFGYISVGTLQEEAKVIIDQGENVNQLKQNLITRYNEEYHVRLCLENPVNKISSRLLFKLFNKSCENTQIARNCRIVQTKLDQMVPSGPTTII